MRAFTDLFAPELATARPMLTMPDSVDSALAREMLWVKVSPSTLHTALMAPFSWVTATALLPM